MDAGWGRDLLAGCEDLECVEHVDQSDGLVLSPLLQLHGVLDEDNEVIGAALEVDLRLNTLSASHFDM